MHGSLYCRGAPTPCHTNVGKLGVFANGELSEAEAQRLRHRLGPETQNLELQVKNFGLPFGGNGLRQARLVFNNRIPGC